MSAYAELVAASPFSFLRGASSAEHLLLTSLLLDQAGLGIADRNTVAGVVRAYGALRDLREGGMLPPLLLREGSGPGEMRQVEVPLPDHADGEAALKALLQARAERFRLLTGTRLVFADGTPDLVAYPRDRQGWGDLCRLLTLGNRRVAKGDCHLTLADLEGMVGSLWLILMPGEEQARLGEALGQIKALNPAGLWLGATMLRQGRDRRRLAGLAAVATAAEVRLIAVNDVLQATPEQREVQDILTCIREGVTITTAGRRLEANAERHLKPAAEMRRLFADQPQAVDETLAFIALPHFDLGTLRYEYPDESVPKGETPQSWLETLTYRHAAERYPAGIPPKVEGLLRNELALIAKLEYAPYFLTIHDIVTYARGRDILCQGRGSAANSAVCYVLGITAVDPAEHSLLFARFISEERREPPDIDVDFEHERREEVIQYLYERYGRHRAGLVATVIRYRPKSAIRDVGKAMGLPEDMIQAISGTQWGSWGSDITRKQVTQSGLDPDNPSIRRVVELARRILGFPRHLSQHVGGFVLARDRLDSMVPIGNAAMADRTFIEWDKDDIDVLGLMKVDVLALGMLTCIRKAFDLIAGAGGPKLALADVPADDAPTYAMLCRGDSIGVFQVESRAQMNMLPRLKPRMFYDLVIQVAIVRPGPIQGNMVHPYLRRRQGLEPVTFPSPAPPHDPDELVAILGKTKGVPLFQEQAMQLAMVAAEFSDVEANQLRRAMATFRNVGTIHHFEHLLVERMVARGYERQFAQNCFEQIKGFGSYGFPESHAASFAKLVYISSWIKRHHPAAFACALLNAQPMGFYAPAQIVRDAREHAVEVRPVDINHSQWDSTLEQRLDGAITLRLGFRQADGVNQAEAERLIAARGDGYPSLEALAARARLRGRPLQALADADAFGSIRLSRRDALWAARRIPADDPLPLFAAAGVDDLGQEPDAFLPRQSLGEHVAADYQTLRLSLKAHPMAILRPQFRKERVCSAVELYDLRDGAFARMAGVVLVRQRPGKGNAVFITLEDETGVANIVLWATRLERFRKAVMGARLLMVEGRVQKSPEGVLHLMASYLHDRTEALANLWQQPDMPRMPLAPADEAAKLLPATSVGDELAALLPPPLTLAPEPRFKPSLAARTGRHPRDVRVLPRSRDFH